MTDTGDSRYQGLSLASEEEIKRAAYLLRNHYGSTDQISDGYHTFGELYAHRSALFIALMMSHPHKSWYSSAHHDDTPMYDGMFIGGMDLPSGQVTYHLTMYPWWGVLGRLPIVRLAQAKEWDGHTPDEALRRLMEWTEHRLDAL